MKIYVLWNPAIEGYFEEYVTNMGYHFKKRGYSIVWVSKSADLESADSGIVLFFWTSFREELKTFPQHTYILVNTEQLSRPDQLEQIRAYLAKHPELLYADYSTANLAVVNTDRPAAHLPFVYHPAYALERSLPKAIPLLFYGLQSDYRKEICSKYGAFVVSKFGRDRDRFIRMSKCVLNAHCDSTYQMFESMRVYHAIYLGTPVFVADSSHPETLILSDTAKKYILSSPNVPDLPPLNPTEELAIGEKAIDDFIFRLSLPTQTGPSSDAPPLS